MRRHTAGMQQDGWIELTPTIRVRAERLAWSASRSGGPGGQHANTTASKATLHLLIDDLVGADPGCKERLRHLAGTRCTGAGVLVLHCDETRSQHRNRDLILERLQELVVQAAVRPRRRRKTKPSRGSVERRLKAKAQRSQIKERRRRVDD